MPMTEDLAAFFNEAEFAESVVIGGVTCSAIFDLETQVVLGGDAITLAPTLRLPTATAPAAAEGTACTVRAVAYKVRQVQLQPPDGATKLLVLTRS